MIKRIISFALCCIMTISFSSISAFARRIEWNEANTAYKSGSFPLMEKLVRIDESNIVDETIDATYIVNEDEIIRTVDNARMFGYGYETYYMDADNWFEPGTTELSQGYIDLANRFYEVPVVRFGGGGANHDFMLNRLGEMANRTGTKARENMADYEPYVIYRDGNPDLYDNRAYKVGLKEMYDFVTAINPDAEWIISLPWYSAENEDIINECRFYLDEKDESEFGALRASIGIEEPINILAFELGNELYCAGSDAPIPTYNPKPVADAFIEDAKEVIMGVKKYHPEAKFSVCLRGNHQYEADPSTYNNWNIWLAGGLGEYIDYASPHIYYSGWEAAYWKFWLYDQYAAFKNALGEDCNVKFMITEHGKWQSKDDSKEVSTHALTGVLAVSAWFNTVYDMPFVDCATYYCYRNSTWAMVKKEGKDWLIMGIPQMMDVYMKNLGDRIVKAELASNTVYTDKDSTAQKLTTVCMAKGDDELIVFLTNRLPYTQFDIKFDFNEKYDLVEKTVFTAPNMYSFVANKATQDVFTTTTTTQDIKDFSSFTMPGKSLVVLKLKKHAN